MQPHTGKRAQSVSPHDAVVISALISALSFIPVLSAECHGLNDSQRRLTSQIRREPAVERATPSPTHSLLKPRMVLCDLHQLAANVWKSLRCRKSIPQRWPRPLPSSKSLNVVWSCSSFWPTRSRTCHNHEGHACVPQGALWRLLLCVSRAFVVGDMALFQLWSSQAEVSTFVSTLQGGAPAIRPSSRYHSAWRAPRGRPCSYRPSAGSTPTRPPHPAVNRARGTCSRLRAARRRVQSPQSPRRAH